MSSFKEFLEEELTKAEYDNLHNALGITRYRCTSIKNNPQVMNKAEVVKLAKIVRKSPTELINLYQCGFKKLTLDEAQQLNKLFNK